MDNFSKFILNWRIEPFVSGKIRVETIRDALIKYKVNKQSLTLVTDGGPENINHEVDNFVADNSISIIPLVALRDIPFSNSLIEAQNKLLKYRYLFRQEYENINDLRKLLDSAIRDYNHFRPHISLKGSTPYEIYSGKNGKTVNRINQDSDIRRRRLLANRNNLCDQC